MKKRNIYVSGVVLLGLLGVVHLTSSTPTRAPEHPSRQPSATIPHASSAAPTRPATIPHSHTSTTASPEVTTASQPVFRKAADNKSFTVYNAGKAPETFPIRRYHTLAVNDPNGSQWWTKSTGLETAWALGAGSHQTTVAVIDTGFALKHEEFAGRWMMNSGEQGPTTTEAPSQLNCTDRGLPLDKSCNLIDDNHDGIVDNESGPTTIENPSRRNCTDQGLPLDKSCNLIDDDGNGYIDDVTGWDFADFDNNVQAGEADPNGTNTTHGTEVTGVLAATGNNGKGIAGVDWTTKVLPIQAIDDDGYGDTLTVSKAIRYAADMHADVISLSLGTSSDDPYLRQTIQYALDKGSIVVAAAGNNGCNCMVYPAAYPEVVAVGAESPTGTPSSFSSYGSSLDILAPGENITSTTWSSANPTSAYVSGIAGTSFATPYVSGLLALARSYQPNATWGELVSSLLAEADHSTLTPGAPVSTTLGSGYARADRLLSRVSTAETPAIRYLYGPLAVNGTLGTTRAYQCSNGDFPTTPVYQLTQGQTTRYTLDTLEQLRASANGWTVKQLWYSCVGLPGDAPTTTRVINLLSEVSNSSNYKTSPSN